MVIIIKDAQTVIHYAISYIILLTSCLRETMLLSLIHDERLYYVFKRFSLFPRS